MNTRILFVDDSESIRELVSYTLSEAGYEVYTLKDGQEALDKLKSVEEGMFNLLITDINMPIMNGIDLVKNVRSISSYKGMPILVLTTESRTSMKQEARSAGATGWIVKPFKQVDLVKTVQKVIR